MNYRKKLLVEGATDKRVLPYLIEANGVAWEEDGEPIVFIEPVGSVDELLQPGVLGSELKASGLEVLGVIVDANGDADNKWRRIREGCIREIRDLPARIPVDGLKVLQPEGPTFGACIMPDNRYSGMLEDFLVALIPDDSMDLLDFAKICVSEAHDRGASYRAAHTRKAEIHTWLAWQDAPGSQLHEAVNYRILDPEKAESRPFVSWFRSLYSV